MSTDYFGADGTRIRHSGGSVRVTCVANVGQGNGGTSLSAAGCWVSCPSGNTAPTKVNIGAAASATLGIEIAEGTQALWIPIDDISQLYFYSGGATDVIDITYLKG